MFRSDRESSCCPWSHGLQSKKLKAKVVVPPAPVRVASQRSFAPSVASVTSVTNDKDDNNKNGVNSSLDILTVKTTDSMTIVVYILFE